MSPNFRTGRPAPRPFEALQLPVEQRRQICLDLLDEFGAELVSVKGDEIFHRCQLPFGNHSHGDTTGKAHINFEKMTFNCLAGETVVKTFDGMRRIDELSRQGGVHLILDGDGRWVEAPVICFGPQQLMKVTLRRNKRIRVIYATPEHRWLVRPKGSSSELTEVTTSTLAPRMRIPSVWTRQNAGHLSVSPIGVMAGFVYGDGTCTPHSSIAYFHGAKDDEMRPFFSMLDISEYGRRSQTVPGMPRSWKKLPAIDEGPSFLYGWLAGLFAADGSVHARTGGCVISSASIDDLRHIESICERIGVGTWGIEEQDGDRPGAFGPGPLYHLSLRASSLREDFFLIERHREMWRSAQERRRHERSHWWVVSVEETERFEPVYCAVVPSTRSFVLEGNVLTGNCWVCGGGGFLWWVATMRGDSEVEVIDWLARAHGVGSAQEIQALLAFLDSLYQRDVASPNASLPHYDISILDQWKFIHPYLTEFRRISADNIVRHTVGYGHIRIKIGENQLVNSERVVIPHFWDGQLVGWQSRRLTDDGTPKYAATPGFPRDTTLFNFDPSADPVVVVEAPISVVANSHVAHFEATFGSAVTSTQLDHLAQHRGDFYLWFDNDPAGWKATEEVGAYLSQRTSRVFVIDSPFAADPADMNPATVSSALSEWRVPWVLWTRPAELLEWRRPDDDQEVRHGIGGT